MQARGLMCLALELGPLFERLGATREAAVLALQCLEGCATLADDWAVQHGLADALILIRLSGPLEAPDRMALERGFTPPSLRIWNLGMRVAKSCESDEAWRTILAGLIAQSTDEPLQSAA